MTGEAARAYMHAGLPEAAMLESLELPAAKRVAIAAVVIVLVAGITAAATYDKAGIPAGGARLTTTGVATVLRADGTRLDVRAASTSLSRGDVVQSVEGTMIIELSDGSTLEGRVGRGEADATKLGITTPVDLQAGELLVASSKGERIDAGGNHLRLEGGIARFSRGLAVGVSTYRGVTAIDSAGQDRSVPALRQMDVSVLGRPPANARPLSVDPSDPWDLRYLGAAIDLTRTLGSLSRSFTGSLASTAGQTPGFYQLLLPGLANEAGFTSALFQRRVGQPQGDTLVGAAISMLGTRGGFEQRWAETFDFFDAGAEWGLVAMDQGVASDALVRAIEGALDRSPLQLAQPAAPGLVPGTGGGAARPPTATVPTVPPGTTSTSQPPTSPQPTAPQPTVPPPTVPPAPPTGTPIVDQLVNTVGNLLGGLLGGG